MPRKPALLSDCSLAGYCVHVIPGCVCDYDPADGEPEWHPGGDGLCGCTERCKNSEYCAYETGHPAQCRTEKQNMKYNANIIEMSPAWIAGLNEVQCGLQDGRWVPGRSIGYQSLRQRIKATWLVWTGRADALIWPGQ